MFKSGKCAVRAAALLCALMIWSAPASAAEKELIPVGVTAGIRMKTRGLTVAGLSEVETGQGKACPAKDAGIHEGDILLSAGDTVLNSIENLKNAVEQATDTVEFRLLREGKEIRLPVKICTSADGGKKIGIWVRDAVLGIGTVTYYDPETGHYGALGHGVNDASGNLIPIESGTLTGVKLSGIDCGEKGTAGELKGDFTDEELGTLELNTAAGIFGELHVLPSNKSLPICETSEIKLGAAEIFSSVSGSVKAYDIKIRAIYRSDEFSGRDMLIEVTDPELIELTGGIVRGMSGSPIVQDGKLVGAVTHVLVNDPHKGYAISVEHMLCEAERGMEPAA